MAGEAWAGAGSNSRPGRSGEWRTPAGSCILQSLACRDFTGAFQGKRDLGGCRDSGSSIEACKAHGLVLSNHILLVSPPASELPGILARAPVGFSLWLTVNGRARGAPALFFFVMRRLWGLPRQSSSSSQGQRKKELGLRNYPWPV